MLKLGLAQRWVSLVMETITIASYSILINGELRGFVTSTRRIKQGDLLSPYFFLLCIEGLLALLRKVEENHSLKRIKSSQNEVSISHILFADDCRHRNLYSLINFGSRP